MKMSMRASVLLGRSTGLGWLAKGLLLLVLNSLMSLASAQVTKFGDYRSPTLLYQWVQGSTAFQTLQEAYDAQKASYDAFNADSCKPAPQVSVCLYLTSGTHVCPTNTTSTFSRCR